MYAVGKWAGESFRERVVDTFTGIVGASGREYPGCVRTETGLLFMPPASGGFALSLSGNAEPVSRFEVMEITRQRYYLTRLEE